MDAVERQKVDQAGYLPRAVSALSAAGGLLTLMVGIVGGVFNVIQNWPMWDTLAAALAGMAVTAWRWGKERRGNRELQFDLKGMGRAVESMRKERDDAVRGRDVEQQRTRGDALQTLLDAGYDVSVRKSPDDREHGR